VASRLPPVVVVGVLSVHGVELLRLGVLVPIAVVLVILLLLLLMVLRVLVVLVLVLDARRRSSSGAGGRRKLCGRVMVVLVVVVLLLLVLLVMMGVAGVVVGPSPGVGTPGAAVHPATQPAGLPACLFRRVYIP
jgi:hypothetical protein